MREKEEVQCQLEIYYIQLQLYPSLLCNIGIGPCKHFPFASWCAVHCCGRRTGETLPGDGSRKYFLSHFWFSFLQRKNPVVLTHQLNTLRPSSLHLLTPERASAVASAAFFPESCSPDCSSHDKQHTVVAQLWLGLPCQFRCHQQLHVYCVTNSCNLRKSA